jgi:K+-sensing histidine kinase KdpD
VSELEAVFERRGIAINVDEERTSAIREWRSDLLHRALLNVLINAADAMPASGAITITTRAELLRRLIGRDGFASRSPTPARHCSRARLARLRSRLHDEGRRATRGFGLGICRRIVQMHDGQIELSSVPGHGTTVSFTLPVRRELPLGTLARPRAASERAHALRPSGSFGARVPQPPRQYGHRTRDR